MHKETPEEIQILLKTVADHFENEDRFVRDRQIRQAKKLKYYWDGFHQIWWSETAHDWRVYDRDSNQNSEYNDADYYDKPVNVFRAYLESIIAALSIAVPSIKCFPDDADNPLDLSTAKAGDKISELIYKHNDVILLWIHALYIYCTEGMIACYSYPKEDYKFGEYSEKKYEDTEEEVDIQVCASCGVEIPPELQPQEEMLEDQLEDEFQPSLEDGLSADLLEQENLCPNCQQILIPAAGKKTLLVSRLVGVTTKPKSRQCIEVYGLLFVKVANYAMKQEDTPYLIHCYETHYANAIERYPHLRDKFSRTPKVGASFGSGYDSYERWGRLSTQYYGDTPLNTTTVRNCWLRHSAFNVLAEEDAKKLKKRYPDGVKVVFVNDCFAEAENECLDDCWTLTKNPLSDYLHHDPLGLLLVNIQDITNDLVSLILQTIEHGIPQTFADPAVVNFEAYRKSEVTPGAIYPTKPVSSNKSIGEGFYEVKTASLSGEIMPFGEKIQEFGQLVSGALPSLFGGVAPGSGKTAAGYSMSRAQALQRLQTPWKMLTIWWKTIFGKVIPAYIKDVKDDERTVSKDENGNFVNVFIRKAELEGKIGSIELEASEHLPITWAQRKDVIMQLLTAANPIVMEALTSPENVRMLAEAIGLSDFQIPGEDDRQKQYEEIKSLLESAPIPMPDPMTGMMTEGPSVMVDPDVDNHAVEANICRGWLVSDAGRLAKVENEPGYRNVLLHMKQHMQIIAQQQMAEQQQQAAMQPKKEEKEGKVLPMAAKLSKSAPQG